MPRDRGEQNIRDLIAEMHALDSKMRIVAQRMKIIEKNERIIGKTLISHNKKMKELEKSVSGGVSISGRGDMGEIRAVIDDFKKISVDVHNTVENLREDIQHNKDVINDVLEDLSEMRYILDQINPLEYVTADQVSELINEKLSRFRRKKK